MIFCLVGRSKGGATVCRVSPHTRSLCTTDTVLVALVELWPVLTFSPVDLCRLWESAYFRCPILQFGSKLQLTGPVRNEGCRETRSRLVTRRQNGVHHDVRRRKSEWEVMEKIVDATGWRYSGWGGVRECPTAKVVVMSCRD